MIRPEMPTTAYRRFGRATAMSLALLLAACGSSGSDEPAPKEPTAVQLAKSKGGVVSEFPNLYQGSAGDVRYCGEIGGTVLTINGPNANIEMTCAVGDTVVNMANHEDNTEVYRAMCRLVSGSEVVVTVGVDTNTTVPACHIPGQRIPG